MESLLCRANSSRIAGRRSFHSGFGFRDFLFSFPSALPSRKTCSFRPRDRSFHPARTRIPAGQGHTSGEPGVFDHPAGEGFHGDHPIFFLMPWNQGFGGQRFEKAVTGHDRVEEASSTTRCRTSRLWLLSPMWPTSPSAWLCEPSRAPRGDHPAVVRFVLTKWHW